MSQANKPIPDGHAGLIPHLVCSPCAKALEFYKQAFGAVETCRLPAPGSDKIMHAQMTIDGLPIFLADDFPEFCGGNSQSPQTLGGTPVTIHRYVENCDAAIERAIEAGATPKMPVQDMFWGDRYGLVVDPFGHSWSFATHLRDMTTEEMAEAMKVAFSQMQ
ncbi:MAG TPA: VOC family protein [Pirellulaceae bacterium]|nr:VOC family protein [Pirellulaceae bacterium]